MMSGHCKTIIVETTKNDVYHFYTQLVQIYFYHPVSRQSEHGKIIKG